MSKGFYGPLLWAPVGFWWSLFYGPLFCTWYVTQVCKDLRPIWGPYDGTGAGRRGWVGRDTVKAAPFVSHLKAACTGVSWSTLEPENRPLISDYQWRTVWPHCAVSASFGDGLRLLTIHILASAGHMDRSSHRFLGAGDGKRVLLVALIRLQRLYTYSRRKLLSHSRWLSCQGPGTRERERERETEMPVSKGLGCKHEVDDTQFRTDRRQPQQISLLERAGKQWGTVFVQPACSWILQERHA